MDGRAPSSFCSLTLSLYPPSWQPSLLELRQLPECLSASLSACLRALLALATAAVVLLQPVRGETSSRKEVVVVEEEGAR